MNATEDDKLMTAALPLSGHKRFPKTPASRVLSFRQAHHIDQARLDAMLAFSSEGRSTRRWEKEGAPPYVEVLFRYMELAALGQSEWFEAGKATSADRIVKFRRTHGIDQAELDRLLGFSSEGRTSRRWENEGIAPSYVGLLLDYMDLYGLEVARTLAQERA